MKLSDFTLKGMTSLLASPYYDSFYIVGHNEAGGVEDNIKIQLKDFIANIVGAVVENDTLSSETTYTISADVSTVNEERILVFVSDGTLSAQSIPGTTIDTSTGLVTFPVPITGDIKIIIFR